MPSGQTQPLPARLSRAGAWQVTGVTQRAPRFCWPPGQTQALPSRSGTCGFGHFKVTGGLTGGGNSVDFVGAQLRVFWTVKVGPAPATEVTVAGE